MAKSKYEFWLSDENKKKRIRFPVLPEGIEVELPTGNETVNIANLGEVTVIQARMSKVISFSSYFPATPTPLAEWQGYPPPADFIKSIEELIESQEPLRFIITGTEINMAVSIEGFKHSEKGGAVGDREYELSLKEYRYVKTRTIQLETKKETVKRPVTKPKAKTYKVKKGDTLWAIAGRADIYGRSLDWKKIWNANKSMLVKRDSRNNRQPGHWIYPGQVLQIP